MQGSEIDLIHREDSIQIGFIIVTIVTCLGQWAEATTTRGVEKAVRYGLLPAFLIF